MSTEDPVTLGEVSRNVSSLRQEVKEGLGAMSGRLDRAFDRAVSSDIYAANQSQVEYRLNDLSKEITELKTLKVKEDEQRTSLRRLVIFSFVIPVFMAITNMVFTFYIFIGKGTGP